MAFKQALNTLLRAGALALGVASASHAYASVVVAGTRVIYHGGEAEQTVKLTNNGESPALTQVWLDDGDSAAAPASIRVPFTVTPPFARIDQGKGQTLRILYTGEPLPQDKESVFWLNVLEIPPKPSASQAEANTLQMAFRTRIKLFYRPSGLAGNAGEAPAQIGWRVLRNAGHTSLEARNPTPYYVSLTSVKLSAAGKTASFDDGAMLAPGQTREIPLAGEVDAGADAAAKVVYSAIDDYGGVIEGEARLSRASSK
jgi:P pilus assembly chaperone PapD